MNEPTAEGKKRYPKSEPPGFYVYQPDEHVFGFGFVDSPCECTPRCSRRCKGECGCTACHMRHMDFVSMGGWRVVFSAYAIILFIVIGVLYLVSKVFL